MSNVLPTIQFQADRAITSRSQDRLNRASFAKALAGSIAGWEGRDSPIPFAASGAAFIFVRIAGDKLAGALQAHEQAKVKPLKTVKTDLIDVLKKAPAPLLVVMDDVDRLTPQEVQQLFQLVKAN